MFWLMLTPSALRFSTTTGVTIEVFMKTPRVSKEKFTCQCELPMEKTDNYGSGLQPTERTWSFSNSSTPLNQLSLRNQFKATCKCFTFHW